MMKYRSSQTTVPERIYNPITTVGFSAMFTFQLDNTKSNFDLENQGVISVVLFVEIIINLINI